MKTIMLCSIFVLADVSFADELATGRQLQDLIGVLNRMESNQAKMQADINDIKSRVTSLEMERNRAIRTIPAERKEVYPMPKPERPADLYGNDGRQNGEWVTDPQNGIPVIAEHVWTYSRVGRAGVWQRVRSHGKPIPVTVWYGADRDQEARTVQEQQNSSQQGLNMNFGN